MAKGSGGGGRGGRSPAIPADFGEGWMTANARDLVKIAVAFGGFNASELVKNIVAHTGSSTRMVNAQTVENILGRMKSGEI